jgi:hypothetical protein
MRIFQRYTLKNKRIKGKVNTYNISNYCHKDVIIMGISIKDKQNIKLYLELF